MEFQTNVAFSMHINTVFRSVKTDEGCIAQGKLMVFTEMAYIFTYI